MLKTATFFAGAMLTCTMAFGQANSARVAGTKTQINTTLPATNSANRLTVQCADTLNTEMFTPNLVVPNGYGTGGAYAGYISGSNSFGDKAKANKFNATGTSVISGALFGFGYATIGANPNVNVPVHVWDATGANGAPGAILATKNLTLSSIVTLVNDTTYFTPVIFDSPVTVTGNYYIGIGLPAASIAAGDTVALITNIGDGSSPHTGWEQWSDDSWSSYPAAWGATFNASNFIMPYVEKAVTASFTYPATHDLTTGSSVTFTNTSTGGSLNEWIFSGASVGGSSQTSPTVNYTSAGTYDVQLVHYTAGGCADTLTQQITITGQLSINEELASKISVYPNPATSNIYINLADVNAKNIQVVNAIGQVVSKQVVSASQANVNVANLSAGMYYVQIETTEGTITKKVSVQK